MKWMCVGYAHGELREVETEEDALRLARRLMTEYRHPERRESEISRSLYALAKRWRLSCSFEDFTVNYVIIVLS